ncbi:MAG: PilZ domain-containing protein [Candidatus Hydrogenedentes bacterium]|nr:PilZ domain-containing protein [Candidatus Hydrogenedentota bacterium]
MTQDNRSKAKSDLKTGNQCLLHVLNQHFLVEITEVSERSVRVSFPGMDYPVDGMLVSLEFHDKDGFNNYDAIVVEGPQIQAGTILLRRPTQSTRAQHRDSCRVATDLTVQIKDQIHIRRFDASLINLSAGGALLETAAEFDSNTTLEMTLSLPGESTYTVLAQILHVNDTGSRHGECSRVYGVRFISPDAQAVRSIRNYIWRRLRELYPTR